MKNCEGFGELLVEYLPLSALVLNNRNARTHSKRQIDQIAESIRAFGFTNPILIDRTNSIVAGHGRFAAAKLLCMDRVPTICLESLTEAQVRAYAIADNRLAEKAGWDKSILAIELQHLIAVDRFDVIVTGFAVAEINLGPQTSEKRKVGARKAGQPVTKSGDVWQLGGHRIICDDSVDASSYEALDVAIRRWQKYTGDPAIHAGTGKSFDEVASSKEVNCD